LRGLSKISLTYDVIAVKYHPCLVARDSHANHFGDATPHHVPYRGAAEIVKEQTSATRGFCYRVPGA
jgi:hypothetical protein